MFDWNRTWKATQSPSRINFNNQLLRSATNGRYYLSTTTWFCVIRANRLACVSIGIRCWEADRTPHNFIFTCFGALAAWMVSILSVGSDLRAVYAKYCCGLRARWGVSSPEHPRLCVNTLTLNLNFILLILIMCAHWWKSTWTHFGYSNILI